MNTKTSVITSAVLALFATMVRADIGPRAQVTLISPLQAATAGAEFAGAFEVLANEDGTLDSLRLAALGWDNLTTDAPESIDLGAGQSLIINFRGIPGDPPRPLRFRASFNGRTIRARWDFSQEAVDQVLRPGPVAWLDGNGNQLNAGQTAIDARRDDGRIAGGSINYHMTGQVGYYREDGQYVGADFLRVEVWDDDSPSGDEMVFAGYTEPDGDFNFNFSWDDCDITGCDDPDFYLVFRADSGILDVEIPNGLDWDFFWSTEDQTIEDFTGTQVQWGLMVPANPATAPAMHINNSIVRTHRFIATRDGTIVPEVRVFWPNEDGSYYSTGTDQIYISSDSGWREDTHTHEFGHHFMEHFSVNTEPEYCNMVCDCEPDACDEAGDCGHCMWCPETDHDAWNEGWPNWLADVVTRSYPADYGGYMALYMRSQENITNTCMRNGFPNMPNNALTTEGFAGALCRDIEDGPGRPGPFEDHEPVADCDVDTLALGVDEIFQVVRLDQPRTPLEFIAKFRARFPQYDEDLWATVNNVSPAYTFPQPPLTVKSQTLGCRTFVEGETLTLSVEAGSATAGFQWRRDGENLLDLGNTSGVQTNALTITPLRAEDSGTYVVEVFSCDGITSVFSQPIPVHVFPARGLGSNGGAWGRDDMGQLARGAFNGYTSTGPNAYPAPMVMSGMVAVSTGASTWHKPFLKADGTVWAAGANSDWQLGQPGITATHTPVKVEGIENAIALTNGSSFVAALRADGKILVWGDNDYGQHGNGQVYGYWNVPQEVPQLECVVEIAAGDYHMMAMKSDRTIWTWGYNGHGELGLGNIGGWNPTPQQVPGIVDAIHLAAGGYHSLVLRANGTVVAFGRNLEGQLGDGTQTDRASPVPVSGLAGAFTVRAGAWHSAAILNDRTVRAWGYNGGNLGMGNMNSYFTPVQPLDVGTVLDVQCGANHTLFLRPDRTVWVTGWNYYGELGPGRPYPEPLKPMPVPGVANVAAIGAGGGMSFVLSAGMSPQISQQPVARTVNAGQSATFTVSALGTATLTYSWRKGGEVVSNGAGIIGATTSSLTFNPVQANMAGTYNVLVSNNFGQVFSQQVMLTVTCAPGDSNCDGAMNAADAEAFAPCMAGPGNPNPPANCDAAEFDLVDMDGDADVDERDFALFQRCFNGQSPIPANCR